MSLSTSSALFLQRTSPAPPAGRRGVPLSRPDSDRASRGASGGSPRAPARRPRPSLLRRAPRADALLASAVSAWDPSFVRDQDRGFASPTGSVAITFVDLADLRLRQQEPGECCRLAGEALKL